MTKTFNDMVDAYNDMIPSDVMLRVLKSAGAMLGLLTGSASGGDSDYITWTISGTNDNDSLSVTFTMPRAYKNRELPKYRMELDHLHNGAFDVDDSAETNVLSSGVTFSITERNEGSVTFLVTTR